MVDTEEERREKDRIRKIKERAPAQMQNMIESMQKLSKELGSEAIELALAALAKEVNRYFTHKSDAKISKDKIYRYDLSRIWDDTKPYVLFICLNPSTADEVVDDPTSKKCIQYAKSWGYGGMHIANLFAYRATNPNDLRMADDPIGKDNDKWLLKLSKDAGVVIAAWGNHGQFLNRDDEVTQLIQGLHCLRVNSTGAPAHPLYLSSKLKPIPYK